MPRTSLRSLLGAVHLGREIISGLSSTRLATLPAGGTLYLTPAGRVVAVQESGDPDCMAIREFAGAPATIWQHVAAHYPGLQPGSSTLPRFWIVVEPTSPGYPPTAGLLDLLRMQVVERGTPAGLVERREWANQCPACYIRMLEHAERTATEQEMLRSLSEPLLPAAA